MIESPLIKEIEAERMQKDIITFLKARFGEVPLEVTTHLQKIRSEKKLGQLIEHAALCSDVEAFRTQLLS